MTASDAPPRETVRVDLPGRAYDIVIGPGLLASAADHIAPITARRRLWIVTDRNVAPMLPVLIDVGLRGFEVEHLVLEPGEATKGWHALEQVVEWLIGRRVGRDDTVVAFGGGVIGDLVGFAAAVVRRGVRFVQIPTTLLAQVDSSVGGKTGINSPRGKNLVGAFHQPVLVLADTALLASLPDRQFLAGYGEVVKYGLLGDAAFFDWLEVNGPHLRHDPAALVAAVRSCCEMKAGIVMRDETEQGERALLNLGHTFCHALETATGYGDRLLHGEGVAIGCALAFELSARLGLCSQESPSRVREHLAAMGMRRDLRDIPGDLPDAAGLVDLMGQDKKVVAGELRFVLARSIGETFVTGEVPRAAVISVLQDSR